MEQGNSLQSLMLQDKITPKDIANSLFKVSNGNKTLLNKPYTHNIWRMALIALFPEQELSVLDQKLLCTIWQTRRKNVEVMSIYKELN